MRPPVDNIRISAKGRDSLNKLKRTTGLIHWNELSRIALCRSLAMDSPPSFSDKNLESNIVIEWKTFAGIYQAELASLVYVSALKHNVEISDNDKLNNYLRGHIERGIADLARAKSLADLL